MIVQRHNPAYRLASYSLLFQFYKIIKLQIFESGVFYFLICFCIFVRNTHSDTLCFLDQLIQIRDQDVLQQM